MKRQFRRAGSNRTVSYWVPVSAAAGLAACLLYGAWVLVPRAELLRGPHEAVVVEKAPVRSSGVPIELPQTSPQEASLPEASPSETSPLAAAPEPSPAPKPAAACLDAMTAALANARIEFRSASAELLPASRNVISVLAALAHTCPGDISIAGHSDDLGPEALNMQISYDRAAAVVQAFVDFDIEPQRLHFRGYGSSRPVAENTTPEGRARNRRIEMTLLDETQLSLQEYDDVDAAD